MRLAGWISTILAASLFGASAPAQPASEPASAPLNAAPGSYLYVWAGDADEKDSDFLAIIDARAGSSTFGEVVSTVPVGARATMPHHIEYESPPAHMLFANGWKAGHTFVLDLNDPRAPRLAGQFKSAAGYSFPHSFARLPNGNVLAVFQSQGERYAPPGGLLELDPMGRPLRATTSATRDIPTNLNWPYSLAVHPAIDRVITTSSDMGMPPFEEWELHDTNHVQLWSISRLKLLASIPLPKHGKTRHHFWPAEPRVLPDGSVYVNTFSCGLYRLKNIQGPKPSAEFVHAFPGGTSFHDMCFVPVSYGRFWIQTVPALPGLVVLDVSNPKKPVEVSRFTLDKHYHMPHWVAADRSSGRLVLTGDAGSWVLMLKLDEGTGKLSLDESFRSAGATRPGIDFDRETWPHGRTGKAVVHGAVFR